MQQKILLVEDDVFLKDIYYETLTNAGFSVTSAVNLSDVLQAVQSNTFDLALIDFYLPGANGIEIVSKLKAITPPPVKRIVFLTNASDEKDLQQMQSQGNGYLLKSALSPQELVTKIKEYLNIS
ncbi:MAG: response regulator [Patescibacteria group bacterium]